MEATKKTNNINPTVSVDCVVFGFDGSDLKVLLVQRDLRDNLDIDDDTLVLPGDLIFEDDRKEVHHNYAGFKEDFDIDTIKIDVEGYEYKVLSGAKDTLKKYKPLMFLEIHGHLLKLYNAGIMDVYTILKECKYEIYDIHMNKIEDAKSYVGLFNAANELRVICKGD